LKNAEAFDAQRIGRYTVIRVYYEYRDQDPGEKLFIALKHGRHLTTPFCMCIKATSKLERFKADKELLAACVFYKARILPFFEVDTIIDPSNYISMLHSTLKTAASRNLYRIEGTMPDDFHQKLVEAIKKHPNIEPKNKKFLLGFIDEQM
jgi:hypothetical protein